MKMKKVFIKGIIFGIGFGKNWFVRLVVYFGI